MTIAVVLKAKNSIKNNDGVGPNNSMTTHHTKTMKTKEESNKADHTLLSKTIAMTILSDHRPKGEGKYQRALLRMERAVHNSCDTAVARLRRQDT